ncbi:glucose dehydrogenase [FAD, quinone]-like [Galleria mellonella]|uniref:Glucose dehydrogenase [FAD, quinone]-like n=1 Tax=Galleria mellonella TaxID=7137 RepID=A0A6J1WRG7_GALME|nr:glucose dehydrogenase [FAD, quinone]-like [Galleria mellonella]
MFFKVISIIFLLTMSSYAKNKYETTNNNLFSDPKMNRFRNGRLFFPYQHSIADSILEAFGRKGINTADYFEFLRDSYDLPDGLTSPLPEYDFIIVGAGSAGSVLASRLSENKNITVLLLEAGKPETLLTDVPALAPYFQATDYTWQYYMEPQHGVCMGMTNERCFWPRGKAVGGTSVINYMIYTRGRPQEWDRIAADGNYGWSYNDVLHYYKKSEKADLDGYEMNHSRNRNGVLPVQFVPKRTKLIKAFLEAGAILGHPTIDYNSPDQLGFGYVQVTTEGGHRASAAKVFLHKQKKRRNLHILPETIVTKVLIDPYNKTAYGVEFSRNGRLYTVSARKEVILSAGPIASPQLLMLSGVGPKDHLNSKDIHVIEDLPVGKTLYDHICFPGTIFTLNVTNVSIHESTAITLTSIFSWLRNGDNELSTPGAVEGIGYIKTPISNDPEPIPDIELISIGGSLVADGGPSGSKAVRRGMRIRKQVFDQAFGSIDDTDTWSAFPMLLHPKSVGYIELKDKNPFNYPKMVGNYLTDPTDIATFVAAIRYIQKIAATEPFQKFGARIYPADYLPCRSFEFDSDAYWECAIRMLTATLHHQIATCRMGPAGDPQAVVDPELRVYGIGRLRVVDSSIIPRTVSIHTNAPAMMIGEKAADMIKATWSI